jgi:hypothetical protein
VAVHQRLERGPWMLTSVHWSMCRPLPGKHLESYSPQGMPPRARLEDEDELMLGAIERSHARVVFHPNRDVLQLRIDIPAGCQQFVCMAPVYTDKMDGAIDTVLCEQSAVIGQEAGELVLGKLAGSLRKLAMADLSLSGNMAINPDIIRRIDEHDVREVFLHQNIESGLGGSVPTKQTMNFCWKLCSSALMQTQRPCASVERPSSIRSAR